MWVEHMSENGCPCVHLLDGSSLDMLEVSMLAE